MKVHVHYRLKCGGDIDGGAFAVGRFDQVPIILNRSWLSVLLLPLHLFSFYLL